jgi:hypothetical protein
MVVFMFLFKDKIKYSAKNAYGLTTLWQSGK